MFETKRLSIKILNGHELKAYAENPQAFALEHHLKISQTTIDQELLDAINNSFLPFVNNPEKEYIFFTLWLMIEKSNQSIVGAFCFHSEPEKGLVEIGYETHDYYRNKGFMTEALTGLMNYLSDRTDIDYVIAETDNDNFASIKIMEKVGFTKQETNPLTSTFYFKLRKLELKLNK